MNRARAFRLPVRRGLRTELVISALIVLVAVAVPTLGGDYFWKQTMLLGCVYLIAAAGLDILRSQAGQMSFGQGAVMGVAAYVTALATTIWELPTPLPVVVGLAAGMVFGLLLALPSLRVQGYYLGFVTMAGALALPEVIYLFEEQTHALTGVNVFATSVAEPVVSEIDLLTILVVVVAVGALLVSAVVQSSRLGRQMRLAGESPEAARTLALSPGRLRMQGFAISSALASIAGVLYVGVIQYVAPGSFTLSLSIMLYFIVIIGGPGTIAGPIAGVVILYYVPDHALVDYVDYRLLIYGLIAFVVMFFIPDGIVGGLRRLIGRVRRTGDKQHATVSLRPVLDRAARSGTTADPAPSGEPLLVVDDVRRQFGSVAALDGASLTVSRGTLHAIVGPNGSGKTTLLNAISGLITVDTGKVTFDGRDITSSSATSRARSGMARTFQKPKILPDFTVWENVDCGGPAYRPIPWVQEALDSLADEWSSTGAGVVPHGQRRFLEVLRALRQGPTLLALDEPAAGLSHAERTEFGQLMRDVVETTGVTVVMVEHDLELVWGSADVISVVDAGRVIATGTPTELRQAPEIAHLFAGVDHVAS